MILNHREHRVPGLNTTSTADISFMLLIFFLVTTNMDIDKGLTRQLPKADKQEQQESFVTKGTTMAIKITPDNKVLVDGKPFAINRLRGSVEAFVSRVGKRHLITLASDPASSYDVYFHVQNELVAAYNSLRDKTAQRMYGRNYNALTQTEKDKVKDACPQRIAETYGSSPSESADAQKGGSE